MSKKNDLPKSVKTQNEKDNPDSSNVLPGWPGYRTRGGRSGYDPIDTRTEAAHTAGAFVQKLFSGQLRIKKPICQILSGILGLIIIVPLFLAFLETMNRNHPTWDVWVVMLIAAIIGLAMLTNVAKNLIKA